MVQKVLNLATQETDNPDLRDRGYVYWRLLSTDPEAAKSVVLGEKPLISDSTTKLDESLLEELIANISTLASVYHKPPESFVTKLKEVQKEKKVKKEKRYEESLLPQEDGEMKLSGSGSKNIFDMDGLDSSLPNVGQPKSKNILDDMNDLFSSPASVGTKPQKEIVLPAMQGNGMQLAGAFIRSNNQLVLELNFSNQTTNPMGEFAIQFNKNSYALAPGQPQLQMLMPGQSIDSQIPITTHPTMLSQGQPMSPAVQICVKNNINKYFFQMMVPTQALFTENGLVSKEEYLGTWKNVQNEHFVDINPTKLDRDEIQRKLQSNNVFYIAHRNVQQQEMIYFSARVLSDTIVFMELTLSPSGCKLCTKCARAEFIPGVEQAISYILSR